MDESKILRIEYRYEHGHGKMGICLEYFLPCTLKKIKQLHKVIEMDRLHKDNLINKLKAYILNEIQELEAKLKEEIKKHFTYKQMKADTAGMVESKKHPNGVELSKDELKKAEKSLKFYDAYAKSTLREAKKIDKCKAKFESLLKEINRW